MLDQSLHLAREQGKVPLKKWTSYQAVPDNAPDGILKCQGRVKRGFPARWSGVNKDYKVGEVTELPAFASTSTMN